MLVYRPAGQTQYPGEWNLCSVCIVENASRIDQAFFSMNLFQNNARMSGEA